MSAEPNLPTRSRGVIALVEDNCTVCMICARECPDWCIYIEGHQETRQETRQEIEPADPSQPGRRPVQRNVLDRFAIDFGLCMYCGICVEACPFEALFWAPDYDYPEGAADLLVHEQDRLTGWANGPLGTPG